MANAQYSPEDILQILKDSYNFQTVFDPEVVPGEELTFETLVSDWISVCDLLPPAELATYYHELFALRAPKEELRTLLCDDNSSLGNFCSFIAVNAVRDVIAPINILGASCNTAAIFKTLMGNLSKKGVDVSGIQPSADLATVFNNKHAGLWLMEVNKIAPGTLSKFVYEPNILSLAAGYVMLVFIVAVITVSLVWQFHLSLQLLLALSIVLLIVGERLKPRKLIIGGYDTVRDMVLAMDAKML